MRRFKRLFFDIETSPNIMFAWTAGYKLNLPPENIIKERAIMCICYKWEGEKQVHSLEWKKGDDKKLLVDFMKVMNTADEVIGHNSDNFDIKWVRTRCLYHGIPAIPDYSTVDTYKLAKKYFRFNSNKLDYISSFLGGGHKLHTGFGLWKSIVLDNDVKAMKKMVTYCKKDVVLQEKVYQRMKEYTNHKTHIGVHGGNDKASCPECESENIVKKGIRVTAAGSKSYRLNCLDCGKWYQIAFSTFNKLIRTKENLIKWI